MPELKPLARSRMAMPATRRFSFPPKYDSLGIFTFLVDRAIKSVPRREEMRVGLSEALANAILHGALGVSSSLREAGDFERFSEHISAREQAVAPNAHIEVLVEPVEGGIEISVVDGGPGFDWKRSEAKPGRGLDLLFASFDRVRWNERGNVVKLFVAGGML